MQKIKVDGKYDFLIEQIKDHLYINGDKKDFDIIKKNEFDYLIIHAHRSYKVSILKHDRSNKSLEIKVNEHLHKVDLMDEHDLLLEKMGIRKKQIKQSGKLKAPMPGLIVEIKVSEGHRIKKGDPLIILKAMKMENILRSPADGTIKHILVKKNQKVEKDAALIQF
ncbi:MAG: acetyl-CoA carboxylase biotin carboxyl carrier protein subunit [Cytophagales bacterium]|nr:acetyl-CoA carboxylase biotin carboxyl carrier protein subunit [Cytophagales bacterium]